MIFFRFLCESIKEFVELVGVASQNDTGENSLSTKCETLQHKLSLLLRTLQIESEASTFFEAIDESRRSSTMDDLDIHTDFSQKKNKWHSDSELASDLKISKSTENLSNPFKRSSKQKVFIPKDHLWSRANSLKKAMKEIIDHTEKGNFLLKALRMLYM